MKKLLPSFKTFTSVVVLMLLLALGQKSFGQAASATWPLTSSTTPTIVGNITASAPPTFGTGLASTGTNNATYGFHATSWGTSGTLNTSTSTDFFQFTVAPTGANSLVITSLTLNYRDNEFSLPDGLGIFYSTSASFTAPVQIVNSATNVTATTGSYTNSALNIAAASGVTLYFRIYFYNVSSTSIEFGATSLVLSGTTVSPITITSFTPTSACANSGATVGITGTNFTGATSVKIGGTLTPFVVNSSTSITATVGAGTTGTISVTTPAGTATSSSTFTVNSTTVSVNNPTATICTGGAGQSITASGASTYAWSPAAGLSATTGATVTANPTVTTTYTVTGTGANGCVGTTTSVITVNAPPTVTVNPTSTSVCIGSGTALTASGATTYSWSPATGLSGTTGATVTASPTVATTYTVTGTSTGVGCTNTATSIVSVNPLPTVTVNPTSIAICNGSSTTLIASSATATSYSWAPAAGLSPTTGMTVTASPTTTTTYTVTGTDGNGCMGSATSAVTVNAPVVTISPTAAVICVGSSTTLTASSATATSYSWSPAGSLSSSSISNPVASPTVTTTYTVTGTDGNGCAGSTTVTVTVNAVPTVAINPTSTAVCIGSGTTLTASGATSYSWSPATGLSSTTVANPTASPTVATTYTVTGTNPGVGCSSTATSIVSVNALPTVSVNPTAATICTTGGGSQVITASGALTYSWSPTTNLTPTTGATVTATPTTTRTYTVTGTDANGCKNTASSVITVNAIPTVTVSPTAATICTSNGGSQVITATGATNYTWAPATGLSSATVANPTATPTVTTTYTVTGTNPGAGCTAAAKTSIITVNAPPTVTVSPTAAIICTGGGSQVITASGATTYAWTPTTGLSSGTSAAPTATPTTTTTYTVTGTNTGSGCTGTATSVITVNAPPTVSVDVASAQICAGGAGQAINASGTGTTYSWLPATGLSTTTGTSVTANPTVTTTYTVTAANTGSGCSSTATSVITVNPVPTALVISPTSLNGVCSYNQLAVTSGGATPTTLLTQGFEAGTLALSGFTSSSSVWTVNSGNSHAGTYAAQYSVGATFGTSSTLISNGINLLSNVAYTITYWEKGSNPLGASLTLGLNAGTSTTNLNIGVQSAYAVNTTYTQKTATFTPSSSGVYYFGWSGVSGASISTAIYIDDISITANIPSSPIWSVTSTTPYSYSTLFTSQTGGAYSGAASSNIWVNSTSNETVYAIVTNSFGCTASASVPLTVPTFTQYNTTGSGTYCGTGIVTLSGSDVNTLYTLSFNNISTGQTRTGNGDTLQFPVTTVGANELYTINASSVSGGGNNNTCTAPMSGYAIITVNPLPKAAITSPSTAVCFSSPTTTVSGTVTATGSWTMVLSDGTNVTGTGSGTWSTVVNPSSTITYTISSLSDAVCTAIPSGLTNSETVTLNPNPTLNGVSQQAAVCPGTNATINLANLLPSTTQTVSYNINGGSTSTANVTSDASGNGSFTVNLANGNNGQTLTVTSIQVVGGTACANTFSSNNSTTLAVTQIVTPLIPGGLNLTSSTATSITGSITAPATPPTGYVIFYSTGSDFPTPADGTTYVTGNSYTFGSSSFIALNTTSAGSFTLNGLNSSSNYNIYVFSYSAEACSTSPLYSSTVFGNFQTTSGPADYFRSQTTGNWGTANTWQSSHDNVNWVTSTIAPDGNASSTLLQNSYNVTVIASTTAANVVINSSAMLTVNSGNTVTLNHGTGTDMDVDGTVFNSGDITPAAGATIIFESGSNYNHTRDGGTIPTASWNNASTCNVSGIQSGVPSGLGQSFGNFIWSSNITSDLSLNSALTTVNGDFTYNPSSSSNNLSLASGSALTLNIGGNLFLQGSSGAFRLSDGSSSPIINVTKSLTLPSGLLDLGSGSASGNINVNGDVSISGAASISASGGVNGNISFSGTTQNLTSSTSGPIANVNFNVNNGSTTTLQTQLAIISGSSFNVLNGGTLVAPGENSITDDGSASYNQNAGGTLQIGSSSGITLSDASGNIQTSARTFNSAGNYIYNGLSAQSTGTGLPVSLTGAGSLTINNAAGVTLSQATAINGTGTLYLTNGVFTTTIANIMSIGSSASASLANTTESNPSFVDGPIQKTGLTAFTFPVGKTGIGYVPIAIGPITNTSTPQTFTGEYIHTSAASLGPVGPSSPQLLHVSGCDYWRLDLGATYSSTISNSSLPGSATTNIFLSWNANNSKNCATTAYVTNLSTLAIGHLNVVSGQSYTGLWTPVAGVGGYNYANMTTTNNTISFAGVSTFSPFTLASTDGTDNPLPIKLDYFTATKENGYNKLAWKAECTSSSSGFVAERSSDGINFTAIDSVKVTAASDCTLPFTYNDYTSTGPKVYYRLKMIDIDGNITYSDIVLILNSASSFELMSIKPNPVQSEAWLQISASQSDKIELVLLTIDGRELQRQTVIVQPGTTSVNMKTASLAKGMYLIRGVFSGGQTNVIPFIKQ